MVKHVVKYQDFNGQEQEEALYFHMSKTESAMLEVSIPQGLSEYIKEVVESDNKTAMLHLFKKVILESYGIKSEDGKRFIKNPTITQEFEQSIAFDTIFFEIATNPELAKTFMEGVVRQ